MVLASHLGRLFEETGSSEKGREAIALFQKNLAKDPGSARAHRGLAMLEAIRGHDEQALALAGEARRRISLTDDLGWEAFWSLLWVLLRTQNGESLALEWLQAERKRHPDWAEFPLVESLLIASRDPAKAAGLRSSGEELWGGSAARLEEWIDEKQRLITEARTAPNRLL